MLTLFRKIISIRSINTHLLELYLNSSGGVIPNLQDFVSRPQVRAALLNAVYGI